jgi:hypothetical protein
MKSQNRGNGIFARSSLKRVFFQASLFLALFGILLIVHAGDGSSPEDKVLLAQDRNEHSVKKSWMSGKYFVTRKQMVPGATVKVMDEKHEKIYLTSTDEEGAWRLNNIPGGNYSVEIFKEGFDYIEKKNVGVRFPFRTVVELQATPSMETIGDIRRWGKLPKKKDYRQRNEAANDTFKLSGKASAIDGSSLLDTEIRLRDFNREINPLRTFSRSDGSFVLEGLPPGFYDLFIMVPGYLPLWIIMDINGDVEITAMMLLQPLNYEATPSELLPSEKPIPPR